MVPIGPKKEIMNSSYMYFSMINRCKAQMRIEKMHFDNRTLLLVAERFPNLVSRLEIATQ